MKMSIWTRPLMRWAALGLGSTLLVACSTTDSAYELVRQQQEQEAFLQSKEIEHWEKRRPTDKQMAVRMLEETQKTGPLLCVPGLCRSHGKGIWRRPGGHGVAG